MAYSCFTSFILVSMVITGAGRSVAAKAFFQVGFDAPLFVTLLYLIGQTLSLVVYFVSKKLDEYYGDEGSAGDKAKAEDVFLEEDDVEQPQLEVQEKLSPSLSLSASQCRRCTGPLTDDEGSVGEEASACEGKNVEAKAQMTHDQMNCDAHNGAEVIEAAPQRSPPATIGKRTNGRISLAVVQRGSMLSDYCSHFRESGESFLEDDDNIQAQSSTGADQQLQYRTRVVVDYRGSVTGLTEDSKRAVQWVHRIPWYLKPCLPGFFNLLNSAMRWASLVYVAASVAEMLISGLELVLSVVAARIIRKRMVSRLRWSGVGVVTIGIILVGLIDYFAAEKNASTGDITTSPASDQIIGIVLIIGQSIMSVFQDIAEELFMQEGEFPATLLLGMEGFFGLIFALILYFPLASIFGENRSETVEQLKETKIAGFAVGFTLLVTITGIFNIMATAVTSSMTRNVWKNLRTILVWVFGLIIFYTSQNEELGEEWAIPTSFYTLLAFCVMLLGVHVYYRK